SLLQHLPDGAGVLDDAVVDDRDPLVLVGVRVRIGGGGRAVGGPAGVPDADGAMRHGVGQLLLQRTQFARRLPDLQPVAIDDSDAGGVIAPILQATKSLHQDPGCFPRPDIPDDSTHVRVYPWCMSDAPAAISARASAAVGASAMR